MLLFLFIWYIYHMSHSWDIPNKAVHLQTRKALEAFDNGMGDNAHAIAGIPEHPAHQGSGKGGMIDVGVSTDEYDVQLIYALGLCLRPGHGKEGRLLSHAL